MTDPLADVTADRPTIDRDALRDDANNALDGGDTGALYAMTQLLLDALDAETRRADTAEESLVELAPSREATFGPDTITLAQVEYDDLLAERAGLSRHLEDSQAEVARLRSTQDPISVGIIEQATRELAERDAAIARMRAFDGEAT